MPRRKSTASAGEGDEPGEDVSMSHASAGKQPEAETGANVEDYLLPRSLTQRLAKSVLPPQTSIHKDALLAISKAATVFVSYLSSNANEETQKKTIAPQDVLNALSEIEFESFRPRLEKELAAYTEGAAQKRKAKKEGAEASAAGGPSGKAAGGGNAAEQKQEGGVEEDDAMEREAKRVKRSSGHESEVATGAAKQSATSSSATKDAQVRDDGDETEELEEEEEHGEEEGEEEEEDEDEDEDEDGEQQVDDADATQPDDDLEAQDSDTARRRNPDLDSDMDSESDE